MPGLQHSAVFGNAVLPFTRILQSFRVDIFQPDKDAIHACTSRFFDKSWDLMAHRIHLGDDIDLQTLLFAQLDQAVE